MVASTSRRKAYQCLGVVAVLGYVLLISRHFSKDTVVILSSKRDPISLHDQSLILCSKNCIFHLDGTTLCIYVRTIILAY